MTSATTLLNNVRCQSCVGMTMAQSLRISLLINILTTIDPMAATDTQSLLNYGSCYTCLGLSMAETMEMALLDMIGGNITAGGGNSPVVYVNDPNVEGLTPANTSLPAVAYSSSGAGAIFGWSVTNQKWV